MKRELSKAELQQRKNLKERLKDRKRPSVEKLKEDLIPHLQEN